MVSDDQEPDEQVELSSDDAAYLEARFVDREQVARCFGIEMPLPDE